LRQRFAIRFQLVLYGHNFASIRHKHNILAAGHQSKQSIESPSRILFFFLIENGRVFLSISKYMIC